MKWGLQADIVEHWNGVTSLRVNPTDLGEMVLRLKAVYYSSADRTLPFIGMGSKDVGKGAYETAAGSIVNWLCPKGKLHSCSYSRSFEQATSSVSS